MNNETLGEEGRRVAFATYLGLWVANYGNPAQTSMGVGGDFMLRIFV